MGKVLVLGAGVMGSALAIYLGKQGHDVNIWGTEWDDELIREMKETRRNSQHDMDISENISLYYSNEMDEAFEDRELIVLAIISKGMVAMTKKIAPYLKEEHKVLSITKGIDEESLTTMSAIIEDSIPDQLKGKVGVIKLGGPIIAAELARSQYTEGVFASKNIEAAEYAAEIFRSPRFKANISEDIEGVDLCAAFKNSYAIGMGIMEGLEGDLNNPKAALMARGAIEMANIVEAAGGSKETALGIAGVGDYYVTSQGGRNGKFGKLLGQGKNKDQALEVMNHQTVEGLAITKNGYEFIQELERKGSLDMERDTKLFMEIYRVLYKNKEVREAIDSYWSQE